MNAKAKETAEQKLLKMIEASNPQAAGTPSSAKSSGKKSIVFTLRLLNGVLVVAIVISLGWVGFEVASGAELLGSLDSVDQGEIVANKSKGLEIAVPEQKGFSYYISEVKRRNIFQPYEEVTIKNMAEVSENNRRISRETESLRLVGVSWFDSVDSASVMIEDVQKSATYFLKQGEKIGNVTVNTIYADSVELKYEDEEIIIRYDEPKI